MNSIRFKIARNPYLMGVLMIVCELTTNITTSFLFAKKLGDTNVSYIIWFILAASFVAMTLKEPVTSAYGTKLTLTYFGIVFAIAALGLIGKPFPGIPMLLLLSLFMSLVVAAGYAFFMFMQKRFVLNILKRDRVT
jgi:glucan phosphoethanolaminetransferase (alkaline phosphatase superfamily)